MKRILSSHKLRIALLLMGLGVLGFVYRTQSAYTASVLSPSQVGYGTAYWNSLPPQGRPENDTNGTVPGNPQNAVDDFRQIFRMIGIYRQRQGGYPSDLGKIFDDINKEPGAYGFSSFAEAEPFFLNPDNRFADSLAGGRMDPGNVCLYEVTNKRPDGTPVGGPRAAGTRDVLAYTNAYRHGNARHFRGQRTTSNPVGFYLVLWDDGKIEQVPYDKQLFVPQGRRKAGGGQSYSNAFPGQAGVPATALTYDQFHQRLGMARGPRGRAGGPGIGFREGTTTTTQ